MIHLGQPTCLTALNQYIKMPTFLQFLTFFQGAKASKSNKQKPSTAAEEIEGFSEQEEVVKLLKERWKCDAHSKGSKTPVYCYHHGESNVCYPLTQSNLAYWAFEVVSSFFSSKFLTDNIYTVRWTRR